MSTVGSYFEQQVWLAMEILTDSFPERVIVKRQVDMHDSPRPHRPDFELRYHLGGLEHCHLIECQSRKRSSYTLADKIFTVRATSDRNRYVFVHADGSPPNQKQLTRMGDMGVLVFSLSQFREWMVQLASEIAQQEIGKAVVGGADAEFQRGDSTDVKGKYDDQIARMQRLIKIARSYKSDRDDPADKAMLSS